MRRYLKRIFRDLFERQSFEDDGVFDWDIIKRQQLAAGGDGSIEMNPDGTARPAAGAGLMGTGGGDTGAGAGDDAGYPGNAATASGRAVADSGKGEGGPADGSRQDDSAGDGRDQGQRRSIISSIR
jgi:hypothetical protein